MVRPLLPADPKAPAAWSDWWTFLCGPPPCTRGGKRSQCLPSCTGCRSRFRRAEPRMEGSNGGCFEKAGSEGSPSGRPNVVRELPAAEIEDNRIQNSE